MTSRTCALAGAVAFGILAAPRAAEAYERQWHVGLGLGYSYLSDTAGGHGFGGGVYAHYGVIDALDAIFEVDLTAHPGGDQLVGSASAGAAWVFDVFQVVGYVGLMAGGYDRLAFRGPRGDPGQAGCNAGRLGFSLPVLGIDYLLTRHVSIGVQGRYQLLLLGEGGPEHYVTAFAVTEYVWGY